MHDLIIIGSGPGGYTAAQRAGALGRKVLLIEKSGIGGICTNEGCIPTKSLLNSAKHFVYGKQSEKYGVYSDSINFNLLKAMEWKDNAVNTIRNGISFLLKKNKVDVIKGRAEVISSTVAAVDKKEYKCSSLIIAAGSEPVIPYISGMDNPLVVTSREILNINELPKTLVIIGGGAIGIEFASFFSSVGVKVHVIEMLDEVLPFMDQEFSKTIRRAMKEVTFHTGSKMEAVEDNRVRFSKDGKAEFLDADLVLISAGRAPCLAGLKKTGLDLSSGGININSKMETNLPGVYAVGDVTGKSFLAHSALRMGEVAVNTICGQKDEMKYNAIPQVVYSLPETAVCGLTETQALNTGKKIKTATVYMRSNGRFITEHGVKSPGLCKVVADEETNRLAGIQLLGSFSSELIYGAAVMIESGITVEKIKDTVFPHPSVSEVIREAVLKL